MSDWKTDLLLFGYGYHNYIFVDSLINNISPPNYVYYQVCGVVNHLLHMCLLVCIISSALNHTSIKYRCSIKKNNIILSASPKFDRCIVGYESNIGLQREHALKKYCWHLEIFLTILQKNINGRPWGVGRPIWSLKNSKNLPFDNEWGIYANFKNYEKVGYITNWIC